MDKMTCFLLMKEKQKEDKETVLKERERFKSYAIFFACTKYETKRRRTIEFSARVHSREHEPFSFVQKEENVESSSARRTGKNGQRLNSRSEIWPARAVCLLSFADGCLF